MKRVISYLLALVMLVSVLPAAVYADAGSAVEPMEISLKAGDTVLELGTAVEDAYISYGFEYAPDDPAADPYGYIYPEIRVRLYTVKIPDDTYKLEYTLSRSGLVYNYDGSGNYLSGWYSDSVTGTTTGAIVVDSDANGVYDFIQIQNTYNADYSGGDLLYALTFTSDKAPVSLMKSKDDLLSGIASGYSSSTDAWTILDMAAYNGSNIKGDGYGTSSAAPKALACAALGEEISGLDDVKTAGSFGIYTVPYLALAYRASGSFGTGDHSETALKNAMTGYLNGLTSSGIDPDCIAPVINGLAPYYGTDADVKAAVDGAIDHLSSAQNIDGSFSDSWSKTPNANSTAMVIVALSSLGIDVANDSRFVKTSGSAISGLMRFALENNTGFGYTNNESLNSLATEQGFRALVSYANMKAKGGAYNIYLEAKCNKSEERNPKPGRHGQAQKEDQSTITASVTVKGYGGEASAAKKTVELPVGSSARDILDHTGLKVSGKAYVSAIDGLAEFDYGDNSGWMYKVNGVVPEVGATEFILKDGDKVVWYYTTDWTAEEGTKHNGSAEAAADGEDPQPSAGDYAEQSDNPDEPVSIVFSDVPAGAYYAEAVAWAAKNGVTIGVGGDSFGTGLNCTREQMVTFLWNLAGKPAADSKGFSDVAGDEYYSDAVAWAGAFGVTDGKGDGSFGVGEDVTREQTVAFLWKNAGKPEPVENVFFFDVPADAYYAKAVAWAYEEGITLGIGNGLFGSGNPCTREQIVTLLYRYFLLSART